MNYVNFIPWVGTEYQNGFGEKKLKLLVLGESHYCKDLGSGKCPGCCLQNCLNMGYSQDDYSGQTIDYIDGVVNNYTSKPEQKTALCFERAVMGKELSDSEREAFWNSIIFYNYVQKDLPKKAGERTPITQQDLVGAEDAFREILETYMPDRVIIWGDRLYNLLPNWVGSSGSTLQIDEGYETDVWTYEVNGKSIPVMKVHHPSTPTGKDWKHWHKFHKKFLK